jgi:hypothetical protein
MKLLLHLLTSLHGTNATKEPREFISAYRGGADSISTSLFSRLMTPTGHERVKFAVLHNPAHLPKSTETIFVRRIQPGGPPPCIH